MIIIENILEKEFNKKLINDDEQLGMHLSLFTHYYS